MTYRSTGYGAQDFGVQWLIAALIFIYCVAADGQPSIYYQGRPLQITGPKLSLNEPVKRLQLLTPDFNEIPIGGQQKHYQLIVTLLNLKLPADQKELRRIQKLKQRYPKARFVAVIKVLPMELLSYKQKHPGMTVQLVTNFKTPAFGGHYGTRILEGNFIHMNARAVFLINPQGRLVYQQFTRSLERQPDYSALKAALDKHLSP